MIRIAYIYAIIKFIFFILSIKKFSIISSQSSNFSINLINDRIFRDKFAKLFKKKDPKEIVIDEFIGQSIPLTFYFFQGFISIKELTFFKGYSFEGWIIISFILFRFFDIVKPFPINIVDKKMKNGLGVMLDDIIAGIYSAITIYIFYALWF